MRYSPSRRTSRWTVISQIIGGILLIIGVLWLVKIVFFPSLNIVPALPVAGGQHATSTTQSQNVSTPSALHAAGITLSAVQQPASLSEAQALQFARQSEPDAMSSAKKLVVTSVTLDYPASAKTSNHPAINHLTTWMIWCQQVPQGGNGIAVDKQASHDLFLFING